jgi:hypothetical protein
MCGLSKVEGQTKRRTDKARIGEAREEEVDEESERRSGY